MAKTYTDNEKQDLLNQVFVLIAEQGLSLRLALKKIDLSRPTFFKWIDGDEQLINHYARAREERAEKLFEEILEIADETTKDTVTIDEDGIQIEKVNREVIERTRIRIDARKWMLGKMQPKKYGDKLDVTSDGEKLPPSQTIHVQIGDKEVNLKT